MPKGTPGRAICSVQGCNAYVSSWGWCKKHLRRWEAHGDPEHVPFSTVRAPAWDRFWRHVEVGDCWLWTGSLKPDGYAQFNDGALVYVHRWAYEALVGPVPHGLELDHLCRVRHCVNPDHLDVVTPRVNNRRQPRVGRSHCPQGHPYHGDNLYIHPSKGTPTCRKCMRESGRRYRERKRVARRMDEIAEG